MSCIESELIGAHCFHVFDRLETINYMWSFWNKERKKNTLAPAMLDARVEFFRFLRAGFDGLHITIGLEFISKVFFPLRKR